MDHGDVLLKYRQEIIGLLARIDQIEADTKTSVNDKLDQIKNIRKRLTKISEAIDIIQKDIKLATYKIN